MAPARQELEFTPADTGSLQHQHGAPGVKQQLAAVRMLFDWRITGQIVPANPAAAVRGPKHNAISVPVSFGFGADALGTNPVYALPSGRENKISQHPEQDRFGF
jgi:hypothetical protein